MKRIVVLAVALMASAAYADLLFDNGGFITIPGNPNISECPANRNTAGSNANATSNAAVADNFTVPAGGWTIQEIEWYCYQTGSSTNSTINFAAAAIYNGSPAGGGQIIAGDLTTDKLATSVFSGVYRVFNGSLSDRTRPVMKNMIDIDDVFLPAGTYYVGAAFKGSLASGPWANYTEPGKTTDDGEQLWSNVWRVQVVNGFPVDYPFKLHGIPEPASLLLLGLGVLLRRR